MSTHSPNRTLLLGQTLSFCGNPFEQDPATTIRHESHGAVLIENGHVAWLGPASEVGDRKIDVPVIDHGEALIMAGFVDCHTHFPQTDIIASYGEELLTWLETYTFPQEMRFDNPAFARDSADFFLDQCLCNGTTTASVFGTVHPQSVDALFIAASKRNLRMAAGKTCMDRNAPQGLIDTAQTAYDQSKSLIETWHQNGRNIYAITPRFAPTSTPEQLEALGALWGEYPTALMQTHLSENLAEIAWVRELFPGHRDYFDVYESFGLTGAGSVFGHAIHLEPREATALAGSGSAIAHCPTSNAFIGSGHFNIDTARTAGIHTGLATDIGAGSSFSMFATMKAAYEAAHHHQVSLHPAQAFWLATLGGAKALRLNDVIGNLAVGYEADLIVVDLASTRLIGRRCANAEDFIDILFAQMILADDRAIKQTWSAGECVYDRHLTAG
jgi:guanine deaminase